MITLILLRRFFERQFADTFGFPAPKSSEELALVRESILDKVVEQAGKTGEAHLKLERLREELEKEERKLKRGEDPSGGAIALLDAFQAIMARAAWAAEYDLYLKMYRLARRVGISRSSLKAARHQAWAYAS